MKVLEQYHITTLVDVGRMKSFDFHRLNGLWEDNPVHAMQSVGNWLIGRAYVTLIEGDLRAFPEYPGFQWQHTGSSHEPLGRLFWNMFHATFEGELFFHDSPDFSGSMHFEADEDGPARTVSFSGDIGQVSASTFAIDVLPQMEKGDLWISVFDERHHLIMEVLDDIGANLRKRLEKLYGLEEIGTP